MSLYRFHFIAIDVTHFIAVLHFNFAQIRWKFPINLEARLHITTK